MEEFSNYQLNDDFEKYEMSLTMKYLIENPALLQPPESERKDKCKDDKFQDFCQPFEQPSAYLGPQIWDDLLQSDDLKLEPVCMDDLLDGSTEDEFSDFLFPKNNSPASLNSADSNGVASPNSLSDYRDMPPLGSEYSPDATQIPSPTKFLNLPVNKTPSFKSMPNGFNDDSSAVVLPGKNEQPQTFSQLHGQGARQQEVCNIQAAMLADIACNQVSSPFPGNSPTSLPMQSHQQQQQQQQLTDQSVPLTNQQFNYIVSNRSSATGTPGPLEKNNVTSDLAPINVRIPSPVKVDFVPNLADVLISTPEDNSGETFDPTTRRFTAEELKPQPIVRKSRKVFVSPEGKDDKYWNRRNKNNAAAKRSREARRIKENQISMRASYLEQENVSLKTEITQLRSELERIIGVVKAYEKRCGVLLDK